MCGEYAVVIASDTDGSQSHAIMGSFSISGRSESHPEMKRQLIKRKELMHDARVDKAFMLMRGSPPLRFSRANHCRIPERDAVFGKTRFHENAGT